MTAPAPTSQDGFTPPRSPLGEVWAIAWPTVLTMTSYTVMQFIDKLMVAQVGALEVAAQGNGGIWTFTPMAFGLGVLTVINTYVSQNLGAGQPEKGPQYAWAGVWLSIAMWALILLPMAALSPLVFSWMGHSDELVRLETGYAQILLVGGVVLPVGRAMHHFFFGLHRPKVITVAAIVGNLVNVGANFVFIFGVEPLGIPAMGVYGAAIGTIIGTTCELLIPCAIFLGPGLNKTLRSRTAWRPRWAPMRDLLRIGWPAAVQFGNEIICWLIFMSVLVGRFGENHMTAGWAVLGYMHLSFMPAVGFSVAVSSLVGRYIGAGQPDTAAHRARLGLSVSMIYMTICAVAMYFFREPLVAVFASGQNVTPEMRQEIIAIGARLMICAAIFQTADALGVVYSGALRGAGDTVWPGVMTMIYSWVFIVLGGWLLVEYVPQWTSVGPWIGASVYIILFGLTMAWRFERGPWRRINLVERKGAGEASREREASPGLKASRDREGAEFVQAHASPGPEASHDQEVSRDREGAVGPAGGSVPASILDGEASPGLKASRDREGAGVGASRGGERTGTSATGIEVAPSVESLHREAAKVAPVIPTAPGGDASGETEDLAESEGEAVAGGS